MLLAMGSTHLVLLNRSDERVLASGGFYFIHQTKPISLSRFPQPFGYRVTLVQTRTNFIEHVNGSKDSHETCFAC